MSTDQMREKILQVYTGPDYEVKLWGMSDRQVAAIYNRLMSKGKIK